MPLARLVSVLVIACLGTALASVEIQCKVKEDSAISAVERSVQFATGSELNRVANTFDFSHFSVYALLWFSQDEVAILEHDGVAVGITGDFDVDDIDRLFRVFGYQDFTQVNGGDREYRITCKEFGRWVDSRL